MSLGPFTSMKLFVGLLILAALVPLAPTVQADCFPAGDGTATDVGVGDATFYHKTWGRTTRYHQVWEESNGIPGLQLDTGMGCGAPRDTLRFEGCVGTQGCVIA